jgi:hypothetical protein
MRGVATQSCRKDGGQFLSPSFDTPRRNPEHPRRRDGIDSPPPPPGDFVSEAMVVPVVGSAQRYRELVADLAPHGAGLSEPQMVRVSGASPAYKTGLRCHELEVSLVAMAARLADGEFALLDFCGTSVGLKRCRSRRVVIGWLRGDRSRSRVFGCGLDLPGASPWSLDGARWWLGAFGAALDRLGRAPVHPSSEPLANRLSGPS